MFFTRLVATQSSSVNCRGGAQKAHGAHNSDHAAFMLPFHLQLVIKVM